MGPLVEAQKDKLEAEKLKERRRMLYKSMISHIIGIITIVAELHIGEKVDLSNKSSNRR